MPKTRKNRVENQFPAMRQFLGMQKDIDIARRFGVSSTAIASARERLKIPRYNKNNPIALRVVTQQESQQESQHDFKSPVSALELLRAIMDQNDDVIIRCQAELWNEIRQYEDFEQNYVDIMIGIEELQRIDAWTRKLSSGQR
jgi:hypothetical protein